MNARTPTPTQTGTADQSETGPDLSETMQKPETGDHSIERLGRPLQQSNKLQQQGERDENLTVRPCADKLGL